ncbi:MAG: histidinol phosphate phosphatase [Rhodospirillaceae bacterium]|mgnify:FL=1|nr:histidinol phosphate phosphatase [Rhodospirillaceae bacterium]|tara:strand:- start:1175 stop:1954 length:780 start_codon:yes stop_codon:yes gene_type:complete
MTCDINDLADFASLLADESRKVINKYFRKNITISIKNDNTQATNVDIEVEELLRQIIKNRYEGHQIVGEEIINEKKIDNSGIKWVLDPIDGTRAFIHGKPTFGTLIAVIKNDLPIVGLIDQPIQKERWISFNNKTNYNGNLVKSSNNTDINKARLEATSPLMFSEDSYKKFLKIVSSVSSVSWGADCYAYGMLANGYVDIVCEQGMKFWDYAALIPIIEGSGGKISDWTGKRLDETSDGAVLASANEKIHEKALKILNN